MLRHQKFSLMVSCVIYNIRLSARKPYYMPFTTLYTSLKYCVFGRLYAGEFVQPMTLTLRLLEVHR